MFCANRLVFKTFLSFPSKFCDWSLSSPVIPFSSPSSFSQKPPFVHHFNFNLQEKCMGSLILTVYFMFFALDFLFCELSLSIVLYGVSAMGWFILLSLFDWVL